MIWIQWIKTVTIFTLLLLPLSGCRFGQRALPTPAPLAESQAPIETPISEELNSSTSRQETYVVQRSEIATTITFSGRITLAKEQELFFEHSGWLAKVYVENGDFVEADTLLAELDQEPRLMDLATAELEVEIVKEQITRAKLDREANQELASQKLRMAEVVLSEMLAKELASPGTVAASLLAQAEFEVTQTKLDRERLEWEDDLELQKELLQAEGRVRTLRSEIIKGRIFAPYSGKVRFITNISNQAGNLIEPYTPILSVLDLNSLQIESYPTVPQQDLLDEDISVEIQLPYRPGISIPATIKHLPYPQGSGVESFTQIEVSEESSNLLRIGAAVEVIALIVHSPDALWLPPEALRGFGTARFVVSDEGEDEDRREVNVTLGVQTENQIEIVSGVEEGQLVFGR